jgi:hypothetical protein
MVPPLPPYHPGMDFSSFFTQLSVGVLGLTCVVPWRAVGKGYYLMNLLVGLAMLPVGWFFRAAAAPPGTFPSFGADPDGLTNLLVAAYGGVAALAVLGFWLGTGAGGARLALAAALLGALAVACDGVREATLLAGPKASPAATAPLLALNFLAGAGVLGSVIGAMLLGHWYLVVKDLPVAPLKALTILLFVFLGVRLSLFGIAWAMDPAGFSHLAHRGTVFLIVRTLFGLGAPIAMSWMIWGTVSIRSTQAATGILYGVVVFILMGEAASRFVLLRTGFPL